MNTEIAEILAKLQRHRGYQGWRIRPYPLNTALWLAETYNLAWAREQERLAGIVGRTGQLSNVPDI